MFCLLPTRLWRQVTLGPVDCIGSGGNNPYDPCGDVGGLRAGVEALPPSVTTLALPPYLLAEREGGAPGAAWRVEPRVWSTDDVCSANNSQTNWDYYFPNAQNYLELSAAFDQLGQPSSLPGRKTRLTVKPPPVDVGDGPEALVAYLGQCRELAGRLRGGGGGGVELSLTEHKGWRDAGAGEEDGEGPPFLGAVLDALLPGAAPHVRCLRLSSSSFHFSSSPSTFLALRPGTSRHLAAPGLAFPLLEQLAVCNFDSITAADVTALAGMKAPRLSRVELHAMSWHPAGGGAVGVAAPSCPLTALAMGLPRPVDAAGRPAGLVISARGLSTTRTEEGINGELAAAGRGWARVELR